MAVEVLSRFSSAVPECDIVSAIEDQKESVVTALVMLFYINQAIKFLQFHQFSFEDNVDFSIIYTL